MSFGLGHGRVLDDAPGRVGIGAHELPPMPDDAALNPASARLVIRRWFADPARPLEIEIGSGKGTFLLRHGAAHPGVNLLGIEWAREFYLYTADRVRRAALPHVRVLHGDATVLLRWRVPDASVRVIHLYFSDPWPKTRHHKRRVVQDAFLQDAARVLEDGGELRVVTDHAEYWAWMVERFARATHGPGNPGAPFTQEPFTPLHTREVQGARFARDERDDEQSGELVGTNFERKYREAGRTFNAVVLRRRGRAAG